MELAALLPAASYEGLVGPSVMFQLDLRSVVLNARQARSTSPVLTGAPPIEGGAFTEKRKLLFQFVEVFQKDIFFLKKYKMWI